MINKKSLIEEKQKSFIKSASLISNYLLLLLEKIFPWMLREHKINQGIQGFTERYWYSEQKSYFHGHVRLKQYLRYSYLRRLVLPTQRVHFQFSLAFSHLYQFVH